MPLHTLFPTLVHSARLRHRDTWRFNAELLRECRQVRAYDREGRRWSAKNYPGGYTSYGSLSRMHRMSSTFADLDRRIGPHVRRFSTEIGLDLEGRRLEMTDCWINVMPKGVSHGLHLHPLSTISGTYYLRTPKGAPGLKLEDPRLDRFMASPRGGGRASPWVTLPAEAGTVILFESWLRHEVPPNRTGGERISISFNYNWF